MLLFGADGQLRSRQLQVPHNPKIRAPILDALLEVKRSAGKGLLN